MQTWALIQCVDPVRRGHGAPPLSTRFRATCPACHARTPPIPAPRPRPLSLTPGASLPLSLIVDGRVRTSTPSPREEQRTPHNHGHTTLVRRCPVGSAHPLRIMCHGRVAPVSLPAPQLASSRSPGIDTRSVVAKQQMRMANVWRVTRNSSVEWPPVPALTVTISGTNSGTFIGSDGRLPACARPPRTTNATPPSHATIPSATHPLAQQRWTRPRAATSRAATSNRGPYAAPWSSIRTRNCPPPHLHPPPARGSATRDTRELGWARNMAPELSKYNRVVPPAGGLSPYEASSGDGLAAARFAPATGCSLHIIKLVHLLHTDHQLSTLQQWTSTRTSHT